MRRLFAVALLALSLGCGSDSLAPVMTVDGNWFGVQNGYSLSLTITQTGTGDVTGNAIIAGNSGVAEGTVVGTFAYPTLQLSITISGFDEVSYTGTMSQSSAKIDGKLNGSGFSNVVVNIAKR